MWLEEKFSTKHMALMSHTGEGALILSRTTRTFTYTGLSGQHVWILYRHKGPSDYGGQQCK